MLPHVSLAGTMVADAELRFSPAGKAIARGRLACNDRRRDESGNWVDGAACFLDITIFGARAETIVGELTKGALVVVMGRLEMREWQAQDGGKRTSYGVLVDEAGLVQRARAPQRSSGAPVDDPWAMAPARAQTEEPPF